MKLYNTLTREIEKFQQNKQGEISIYACGPTVYSFAHIGNFRSFLTADLIVRTLRTTGRKVNFVCNITDVGHLTQDDIADISGDDKLAKAFKSQSEFANIFDLARFFVAAFLEDWKLLNLVEPNVRPRASEHIIEQLELISELESLGFAYETDLGVYFDVSKFDRYGELSGNTNEGQLHSQREIVSDPKKRSSRDFALWKKDKQHLMRWHSRFGWGYPGWHIECSAMAMKYLGQCIDIHTGGEDNIFPHHECEIAQSEAVSGSKFVNYWIHTRHLRVNGEKMAKSAGNFKTVRDVLGSGVNPMALRYALTTAKYREPLNLTDDALESAQKITARLNRVYNSLIKKAKRQAIEGPVDQELSAILNSSAKKMEAAMLDDLNTPVAYSAMNKAVKEINSRLDTIGNPIAVMRWFTSVENLTGIRVETKESNSESHQSSTQALLSDLNDLRSKMREDKNFDCSDAIRDVLTNNGMEVGDKKNS